MVQRVLRTAYRVSLNSILITFFALRLAHCASTEDPAATHFQTGLAYERLGRYEEAYTELQLAFALDQEDVSMAVALGVVACRLGRLDVAQRAFERSLSVDSSSVASYFHLALLYEKSGVPARALDAWHRFASLNQDDLLKGVAQKHIQYLDLPPNLPPKMKRISVVPFEGPGASAATDELVRALLGAGLEVADAHHQGDAILKGAVTEYKSNNQLTVFLGNTPILTAGGQSAVVDNPVVSQNGSQLTPEGSSLGAHHTEVVTVIASVGIRAKFVDAATKNVVWTGDTLYEGVDLPGTLHAVTDMMTRSMVR